MTISASEREQKKIREIARQYKSDGYEVVVEPHAPHLPAFLRGYQPDIIATKGDDKIIIEVKAYPQRDNEKIKALAGIIDNQKDSDGWRFVLVVSNPRSSIRMLDSELDTNVIRARIDDAKHLLVKSQTDPAILLAWSALEGALRKFASQISVPISKPAPDYLLKKLYTLGELKKSDYNALRSFLEKRNKIAHGYSTPRIDRSSVETVLNIAIQTIQKLIV